MKNKNLLVMAALSAVIALSAETVTWTGGSSGNWAEAINWSAAAPPTGSDTVIVNTDTSITFNPGLGMEEAVLGMNMGGMSSGALLDILTGTLSVGTTNTNQGLYMSANTDEYSKITVGGAEDNYGVLKVAHKGTGSSSGGPLALAIGYLGESQMDVTGYGRVESSGKVAIGGYGSSNSYPSPSTGTGTLNVSGNAMFSTIGSHDYIAVGASGKGYLNISDNAKVNLGGFQNNAFIGYNSNGSGEVRISGNGELTASWGISIGWNGEGKVIMTDNARMIGTRNITIGLEGSGTLELNDSSYVETINNLFVGQYSGASGKITINGGDMVINQDGGDGYGFLVIGFQGSGEFTINDGSLTMKNAIYAGYETGSTGTVNLNGGIVETKGVLGRNGNGTLNIDGVTLKAADVSYTSFISDIGVNMLSGGMTLDTNSQNLRINSVMNGSGDLTKTGAGKLSLSQANTSYSGDIAANAGGIVADHAYGLGNGIVYVNSGASLDSTVAIANAGGIQIDGGTLANKGADAGEYVLTKDFIMNSGRYELTILSPSEFDTIAGNGANSFVLNGGIINLTGSSIDYSKTYLIFANFLAGTVDEALSIIGYDTANWEAGITTGGLLYFTQVIPEPSVYAAIFGFATLLLAIRRRKN